MFKKWDLIYINRFPETVICGNPACHREFTINEVACEFCGTSVAVSNIVAKIRPVLLWLDQSRWYQSMSFAIPLSTSSLRDDLYNKIIRLEDYVFTSDNLKYHQPMRAMIHQATRIDGNVLHASRMIGRVINNTLQKEIEEKLFNWIF